MFLFSVLISATGHGNHGCETGRGRDRSAKPEAGRARGGGRAGTRTGLRRRRGERVGGKGGPDGRSDDDGDGRRADSGLTTNKRMATSTARVSR